MRGHKPFAGLLSAGLLVTLAGWCTTASGQSSVPCQASQPPTSRRVIGSAGISKKVPGSDHWCEGSMSVSAGGVGEVEVDLTPFGVGGSAKVQLNLSVAHTFNVPRCRHCWINVVGSVSIYEVTTYKKGDPCEWRTTTHSFLWWDWQEDEPTKWRWLESKSVEPSPELGARSECDSTIYTNCPECQDPPKHQRPARLQPHDSTATQWETDPKLALVLMLPQSLVGTTIDDRAWPTTPALSFQSLSAVHLIDLVDRVRSSVDADLGLQEVVLVMGGGGQLSFAPEELMSLCATRIDLLDSTLSLKDYTGDGQVDLADFMELRSDALHRRHALPYNSYKDLDRNGVVGKGDAVRLGLMLEIPPEDLANLLDLRVR